MPIFELMSNGFVPLAETELASHQVLERDIQRLVRDQVEILTPNLKRGDDCDLLIVAEEFSEWEGSSRRIDLLAIDRDANLVVIELKRTRDGGHMELQSLRYAAMVSTMTFERVTEVYQRYLEQTRQSSTNARQAILDFLGWDEPDEDAFAQDVKVILVSAGFSKEITTSVLWFNERGIDIRCVRIKPYRLDNRIVVDVQQVIPLPEAEQYQIRLREKEMLERQSKAENAERYRLRNRFWTQLLARDRSRDGLLTTLSPPKQENWIATGSGISGVQYLLKIIEHETNVQVYIRRGNLSQDESRAIFNWLHHRRSEIESAFGQPLEWVQKEGRRSCTIEYSLPDGGYREDEQMWPEIHDRMLDALKAMMAAFNPHILDLKQLDLSSVLADDAAPRTEGA